MKNETITACAEEIDQLVRTYKNPRGMANVEAAIRKHFGESAPEQKEGGIDDYNRQCAPVAPSVDTNAERCDICGGMIENETMVYVRMRPWALRHEQCGPFRPQAVPADAPQEPTCARGDELSKFLCGAPRGMHCDLTDDAEHLDDITFCPLLHHAFVPPVVESSVLPSKSEYARGRMDEMQGKPWNDKDGEKRS